MKGTITIPFSRPTLGDEELEAVKRVLESGWLTTGNEALQFEKEMVAFLQVPGIQSLAVQSCTAGLHLAYLALGVSDKHTIITSPFTFTATASMAIQCGAKIEFIDCAKDSLYPDADSLDALPKNNRQLVLTLVSLAGYYNNYDEMIQAARNRNLFIVEDAAHALPAKVQIQDSLLPYGTIGDIGVYSFYANKTMTTGEGGMIVSKNQSLINSMEILRSHGMTTVSWERFNQKPDQFSYNIEELGYKYNMPDILACIGRVQLQKIDMFLSRRASIAKTYLKKLAERDYWILPPAPTSLHDGTHAWHLFTIQITHKTLTRDDFMRKLAEKGIGTSVHYTPLHIFSYFKKTYGYNPEDFPNALLVYQRILSLPIYPDLTEEDVELICNTLMEIGDL